MLTVEEIRLILERLEEETVIEPTSAFPFRVTKKAFGYAKDGKIGKLQAKLSVMLEAAVHKK